MTAARALTGINVVERTSQVRGRYCGRVFAELGASVVRFAPGMAADADSPWLDASKHVVALELGVQDSLEGALASADVFIEDAYPSELQFSPAAHPRLVHVSVSPFGLDGPWAERAATDVIVAALSGIAGINGYADGMPLREPGPQTEMVGALMGFIGALTALEERDHSGLGQVVEVSTMESMLNVLAPAVVQWSYTGSGPQRRQRGADALFQCADGWISLFISANKAWENTVSVLDVPVEAGDTRFATELGRRVNARAMRELLEPILRTKTRHELFSLLSPMRVVCGMVMEPKDLLQDEHLIARDAFATLAGTEKRIPRVPIRTRDEKLPDLPEPRPPAKHRRVPAGLKPTPGRLPLEHIVVADLTQAWAGAYAMQLLADLGATIIKIESRTRPDPWRGGFRGERGLQAYPTEGPGERPYNRMWLTNSVNRNKLGITLDLADPEGRELFLSLVRQSDVVAENFTPRVLNNFDLGYERLREENPDIILLSMPGYGLDGPYSDYPAIGGTIEPMSGNAALLGEPGGMQQTSGLMYPDAVAGLHGAAAVLAALRRRAATGDGSHMEISQHEAMLSMTAPFYVHADLPVPVGNVDPRGSDERIEPSGEGWVARSGDMSAQVRSIHDLMACEHLRDRGFFVEVDQVDVGKQTMPGVVPKLHRTPGAVRTGSPGHGQDSRHVLRERLGLDEDTLDRLEARGIIGAGPPARWEG